MDNEKQELEILQDAIKKMRLAKYDLNNLECVSDEEYESFGNFLEDLEDRKMALEIKLELIKVEEV